MTTERTRSELIEELKAENARLTQERGAFVGRNRLVHSFRHPHELCDACVEYEMEIQRLEAYAAALASRQGAAPEVCDCEIYQTCDKCRGTNRDASLALQEALTLTAQTPPSPWTRGQVEGAVVALDSRAGSIIFSIGYDPHVEVEMLRAYAALLPPTPETPGGPR